MALKSTNWGNYTASIVTLTRQDYLGPNQIPGSPPSIHVRDVRLSLIDSLGVSLKGKRCLDVGCNDGTVGTQLAFDFGALQVVGVDIDPKLVKKADELLALRRSRVRPPTVDSARVVDYFPMSAVLGYRYSPHATPSSRWPHVKFIAADCVSSTNPALSGSYDVILALSVLKWIHLEHLDEGVVAFFRKCNKSLVSGGYLAIELQTWDSYSKAVRPNAAPHFAESLKNLKYRPETSFTRLLQDEGLNLCATSDQLRRQINIYRKA